MEEQSKWQSFSNNLFNVLMLIAIAYLLYLIGNVSWKNYKVDKEIDKLKNEREVAQISNESAKDYLAYYKSNSYQELEIRRRLMLKKPGENVVLLPIHNEKDRTEIINQEKDLIEYQKQQVKLPNYYKWWLLIINKS